MSCCSVLVHAQLLLSGGVVGLVDPDLDRVAHVVDGQQAPVGVTFVFAGGDEQERGEHQDSSHSVPPGLGALIYLFLRKSSKYTAQDAFVNPVESVQIKKPLRVGRGFLK